MFLQPNKLAGLIIGLALMTFLVVSSSARRGLVDGTRSFLKPSQTTPVLVIDSSVNCSSTGVHGSDLSQTTPVLVIDSSSSDSATSALSSEPSLPSSCFENDFDLGSHLGPVIYQASEQCGFCREDSCTDSVATVTIQPGGGETSWCSVNCSDVCEWMLGMESNTPFYNITQKKKHKYYALFNIFRILVTGYNVVAAFVCLQLVCLRHIRETAVERENRENQRLSRSYHKRFIKYLEEHENVQRENGNLRKENNDLWLMNQNVMVALAQNGVYGE